MAGHLEDEVSAVSFICGNRVVVNEVARTIFRQEPADHESCVHGEVNLNLIMSGDRIEGQIGERKGAKRVGNRFVARRLDDAHHSTCVEVLPEIGQLGTLTVVGQVYREWSG